MVKFSSTKPPKNTYSAKSVAEWIVLNVNTVILETPCQVDGPSPNQRKMIFLYLVYDLNLSLSVVTEAVNIVYGTPKVPDLSKPRGPEMKPQTVHIGHTFAWYEERFKRALLRSDYQEMDAVVTACLEILIASATRTSKEFERVRSLLIDYAANISKQLRDKNQEGLRRLRNTRGKALRSHVTRARMRPQRRQQRRGR